MTEIEHTAKRRDIRERTFAFAVRLLKVVDALPRSQVGAVLARQLARAGTSVGANTKEAEAAHTRVDFARKMNIARGEARETLYWLRLIAESGMLPKKRLSALADESEEIVRILTTIVRNARKPKP